VHSIEGTVDQVIRGEAGWCVVHGDALHVLRDVPDGSVDAFVTDPPYSSGGAFRGDRVKETTAKYVSTNSGNREIPGFEGDVRDQRSFTLWTALWSSEAWRAGVDGCHLVAFSDWRQLPSLCDAVQAGGWLWRGIAAWDKTEASRPRNGGFRAQCEFIT
jgi:site-specific DNA-methyltransferase (adenine-specific)